MPSNYKNTRSKALGLSLVELMVALVISSVVMMGIYQVYISSSKSTGMLQAESELQEKARYAFSIMTSVIQEAGNYGCRSSSDVSTNSLLDSSDASFQPWKVIEGWEATGTAYGEKYTANIGNKVAKVSTGQWATSGGATIDKNIKGKKKSDVLRVWYTKNDRVNLTSIAGDDLIFPSLDLKQGNVIIINDCKTVNFAQVCSCDTADSAPCDGADQKANIAPGACNTPGNTANNFTLLNVPTTEVSVLEHAIFYVGKRDDDKENIPTLYIRHFGTDLKPGPAQELLEGVESMQILYGEDTDSDKSPDYYASADSVTDWENVISVRISLLLRTRKNNLVLNKQRPIFNGAQIVVKKGDRHLRKVYTFTVSLRNRNIGY